MKKLILIALATTAFVAAPCQAAPTMPDQPHSSLLNWFTYLIAWNR